jgi:hypothetical protein
MQTLANQISERKEELDITQLAGEAAADFALTIRRDIMMIACIDLQEQVAASRPGFTRFAPVVSGMFRREFLRAPVDILKQQEVCLEGIRVTLIACSRGAYLRALALPMLEAAFGKAIAQQICEELRKQPGRVPVLFATQRAFCGSVTVPAASRNRAK